MELRRRSIRLADWDYTRPGAYYVTICTQARECLFSDEAFAAVVDRVWRDVASGSRPLDEFVVMPNHVHGVIWIAEREMPVGAQQQQHPHTVERMVSQMTNVHRQAFGDVAAPPRPAVAQRPTQPAQRLGFAQRLALAEPSAKPREQFAFSKRPVEAGSLSAIVRTFKSATAKRINRLRRTPGAPLWQRNYYEHIIRDEDDLSRIREYIRDNPAKWAEDPLNPDVAGHREPPDCNR